MAKMNRKIEDYEYVCTVWIERDRAHLELQTPMGRTIFSLWDEQMREAIDDGYLPMPRHPRPTDDMWQPCAVSYARSCNFIK